MNIENKLEKKTATINDRVAKMVSKAVASTTKSAFKKVLEAALMVEGLKVNYPSITFDAATNDLLALADTIRASETTENV